MPYRLAIPQISRRMMGIEPTNARATIWCVNHFTTFAIITRAVGIEPTLKVLETLVLPLNYARSMEGEGFEPPNPKERIYSPPRLASSLPFHNNKNYSIIVFVRLQVFFTIFNDLGCNFQ